MNLKERESLDRIVDSHDRKETELLQILRDVQDKYRHVSVSAMQHIASSLAIPQSQVRAIVDFYSFLSEEPLGLFDVRFSDSITDHMLGSREMLSLLANEIGINVGETRSDGVVSLNVTSCTGRCDQGPAVIINGYAVSALTPDRVYQIADLINNCVPHSQWPTQLFHINNNIHREGPLLSEKVHEGAALAKAASLGPEKVLDELELSGLRGRGGAGFGTASKWRYCRDAIAETEFEGESYHKYVVCNADEGEPGTFKDRVLLESRAHDVFEGMTLCAFVTGARKGFIYLRGEYRHLYKHLLQTLETRREKGLIGKSILGQPAFDFDITIHLGAGAYVCGEETALIESLEGKRGIPRNRPPYPVTHGYLGYPTVINNVESFFAVTSIVLKGGAFFAAQGTAKSKGSKLLSISGDCARPGIYEYVFGVKISKILADCGAEGTLGVQVGGPSGTFISSRDFDRRLAFEDLSTGGSFIIFNKTRDLLAIVQNFTRFFEHESCGFCTPCRVGTSLVRRIFDKIVAGHGTTMDLQEITELSRQVSASSHCGLGQAATNPILNTLDRFPEVYQSRLSDLNFQPGFDLDEALSAGREFSGRDDENAHIHSYE